MSEFINTIDQLGDDVVLASLIDRSITEIKDNVVKIIGGYAFQNLSLTTIDFPEVTEVGTHGFDNAGLTEIYLPKAEKIASQAFKSNTLVAIHLPAFTGRGTYNGSANGTTMLSYCNSLEIVDMPNLETVPNGMCEYSKGLKSICFPKASTINTSVFRGCSALTTADFPKATTIAATVFVSCSSLTALILRSETMATLLNVSAIQGTPIFNGTGYIYVPRALLSDDDATKDYRRATNWSTYANQFRALEDWTVDGTISGELDWDKINAAA